MSTLSSVLKQFIDNFHGPRIGIMSYNHLYNTLRDVLGGYISTMNKTLGTLSRLHYSIQFNDTGTDRILITYQSEVAVGGTIVPVNISKCKICTVHMTSKGNVVITVSSGRPCVVCIDNVGGINVVISEMVAATTINWQGMRFVREHQAETAAVALSEALS